MTKDAVALGMVALKHAMDRIRPAQDALRAQAAELLRKKDRVAVELGGEVVGFITKSAPNRVARINDEPALLAWMQEHYPEHVEDTPYVENLPQVIELLKQEHPRLVHYRTQVKESWRKSLLDTAASVGMPVGPGGEADVPGIVVNTPDGVVSVRTSKDSGYLIEQLFADGVVSLDGSVRAQIEGAA